MQLVKPGALGFLSRPIEYRKRFGLCLSVLAHVPMAQGERGSLWGEQSMWKFLAAQPGLAMVDEGMAKLTPEFLVVGRAHAPEPTARGARVRATLGGTTKEVLAFAPRHWDGAEFRWARPYEPVPLRWEYGYGGPDYPANPLGMGRAAVEGVRWLPQLELPHARVTTPDAAVQPAGFGALDLLHPQRAALRGTYDGDYLQQHAPGFPPDLDWSHFNMAPRDQWLGAPLAGDEAYALENMHPTRPLIEGHLPGLRARAFSNYTVAPEARATGGATHKLKEVPLRLTTVWFFPEAERMVLVWHGLAEVGEADGADIAHLLVALERPSEPRPDAHYVEVLEKRLDPVHGGIESLDDSSLLPLGVDTTDPDFEQAAAPFRMEGLQGQAQRRRADIDVALARERLMAEGRDPDAMGVRLPAPEPAPTPAQLPGYLKARRKEMDAQRWAMVDDLARLLEKALAFEDEQQVKLADLVHRGPPLYDAERHLAQLKAEMPALPMLEAELLTKLRQREAAERLGYWQSAHLQPPARPLAGEQGTARRREIMLLIERQHRVLPWIDLTGVDLSDLDLRGFDFSAAWLESVNLRGANISGCSFKGAVLAHAVLDGCVAIGADFTGANLGCAQLAGAVLDRADLSGAVLMRASLAHSRLVGATLAGVNLLESQWGPADWSGARLGGLTFYKLDLRGLVLVEADLTGATFVECDLRGIDASGALLGSATFVDCRLQKARLHGARAAGAVFTRNTVLDGLDAAGADFSQSNWGECSAVGVRAPRAVLDGANFGMADLRRADLRQASARGALLRKARCNQARMAGLNAQDAVFAHANLRAVDFRQASLFGADLTRVVLDGDTLFEGANLERCRTWPRLSAAQQAQWAARDAALDAEGVAS